MPSMPLVKCSALLGVKTDTLKRWQGLGCPGEKTGATWSVDPAKVFAWKIEQVRGEGAASKKSGEGFDGEHERARKDHEMANRLELANEKTRGETVSITAVKRLGEGIMVALKQRILAMDLEPSQTDKILNELAGLAKIDWCHE